jgi:hypothetical protein
MWWKPSRKLQGIYNLQRATKKCIPTTLSETVHSLCPDKEYPTNSTRNYICSNNQEKFVHAHKYRAGATYKSKSSSNQLYVRLKKHDQKPV